VAACPHRMGARRTARDGRREGQGIEEGTGEREHRCGGKQRGYGDECRRSVLAQGVAGGTEQGSGGVAPRLSEHAGLCRNAHRREETPRHLAFARGIYPRYGERVRRRPSGTGGTGHPERPPKLCPASASVLLLLSRDHPEAQPLHRGVRSRGGCLQDGLQDPRCLARPGADSERPSAGEPETERHAGGEDCRRPQPSRLSGRGEERRRAAGRVHAPLLPFPDAAPHEHRRADAVCRVVRAARGAGLSPLRRLALHRPGDAHLHPCRVPVGLARAGKGGAPHPPQETCRTPLQALRGVLSRDLPLSGRQGVSELHAKRDALQVRLEEAPVLLHLYHHHGDGDGGPQRPSSGVHPPEGCLQAAGGVLRCGGGILERGLLVRLQHHRADGIAGIGGEEAEEAAEVRGNTSA